VLRIAGDSFLWFGAKEGLYTSDATAIVEDHEGCFWITCQQGIYRVRKDELNAFAAGRVDHVSSTRFGRLDGLDTPNTTGQGTPHGFLAHDGKLWFPTQAGLARIDPGLVPYNSSPPPIEIESCSAEKRPLDCVHGVTLKPGMNNLEIAYTGLSLSRSHQIHFRYRLEGLDDRWLDVGTRRVAYFTHLPPGKYRFQVAGANSDGVWNQEGKAISIVVQPHFYQALWFYVVLVALLAGLLVFAWRARADQFEKQQALQRAFSQQVILSQEAERKRIAAELHDSLGQRLALIRSMAMMVSSGKAGDDSGFLETIATEASQGIGEVRQISYDLRPHQLDLLGLSKATEVLTERFCHAAGVRAEVHVDDLSGAFPQNSEIHFYRIVQEFLNNVVKHSRAKGVLLTVRRTDGAVVLSVKDDGIGFVAGASGQSASGGGFGLFGIRERVDLLGGSLSVRSTPGAGTVATVEFSLDGKTQKGTGPHRHRGAAANFEVPLDESSRG
jgi:signal transduction histidine kinase